LLYAEIEATTWRWFSWSTTIPPLPRGVIVGVTFGGIFFSTENSVGGFTRHYLGTRVLSLTKDFGVDDRVMKEFEQFLSAHDVHCTQADWDRKIGIG
jgi:hypothetical protein